MSSVEPSPFDSDGGSYIPDDARAFELPVHRRLREVFNRMAAENRMVLHNFDPNVPDAEEDMLLGIDEEGVDAVKETEPLFAARLRQAMLQDLGLAFEPLEAGHPDCLFTHTYYDGEAEQIYWITRQDGKPIPVYAMLKGGEHGNVLSQVQLLSYQGAAKLKQELEDRIEGHDLGTRLAVEFGASEAALDALSLSQMRELLADYNAIQNLPTTELDMAALDGLRQALVRAVLPSARRVPPECGTGYQNTKAAYMRDVESARLSLDTEAADEFMQSERARRLQALGEQLRLRQHATKVGAVVVTSLVTLLGTGGGAGAGAVMEWWMHGATYRQVALGAVGAVVGAVLCGAEAGRRQVSRLRWSVRHASNLEADRVSDGDGRVSAQLRAERALAGMHIAHLDGRRRSAE